VIRYAVDIWKVDIISMSFGFRTNPGKIGEAIQYAQSKNTLVFAAAGNSGSLEEVRYPARHPMALCVHAATGHGNTFEGNPTKRGDTSNFALLGVAVRGKVPSDPNEKLRSGTSQATAVAAGVAALILQIMRDHEKETGHLVSHHAYTDAMIQLRQIHGMREVFKSMCNRDKRGEYDIVEPWRLLQDNITPTAVAKHLCAKIVGLMDIRSEDD
jgi:subtilisin family serine protease